MKLGFVYDAVYPWESGGIQKRVWEISRRLADRHDVHWYGLHYWDGPPIIEREGVTLHGVMEPQKLYVDGRRSIQEAISFAAKLGPDLIGEEFDLIDCQAFPYFPCFVSKLQSMRNGTTFVVTWHEVWQNYWYEYLGWKGGFGKVVERLVAYLPDEHVGVSRRTQLDVADMSGSDVHLLPNGISVSEVRNAPSVERNIDVLFVGRLIPEKNVGLLIRAVNHLRAEMPNIRCLVVGDGPERRALSTLVTSLGVEANVELTGHLESYDEVLGCMKAAGVFTLPSQREGFGITVLEAMAAGTPVVTLSHPRNAATELISDETGALCGRSPESLASTLRDVLDSDRSQACITFAEEYDWDRIADRAETFYRKVA